ncbi:MAG: FAD-binding oxidoreductase [Candidatus Portnoybacteria bacterium]|nr:FAD-binding oxidoreductase [Candidatus Portnoybacteria bacterium]
MIHDSTFEELAKILKGEVKTDEESLRHYSADGSIFEVMPQAVVFPSGQGDLFNLVKFIREKKEAGMQVSLTARGKGTDLTGSPINEGIIVRFSGYFDKILEIGDDFVRVEPGIVYGDLQKELAKKGHWIPVNPASGEFCSVGGMAANNSGGTKSLKYGETRDYIRSLKVILEDGVEIKTDQRPTTNDQRLQKLKSLIEDNRELITTHRPNVTKNASGYALYELLEDFDLTQLFIGSEGTLGLIKEITFKTVPKPEEEGVIVGYFDELQKAGEAVTKLLPFNPCALEMVDRHIIDIVRKLEPSITESIPEPSPAIILFCEFDGSEEEVRAHIEKARPIMEEIATGVDFAFTPPKEEQLWQLRISSAKVIEHMQGIRRAVPLEIDAVVPPANFIHYIEELSKIFNQFGFQFATWGHAGDGNLHIRPIIDITSLEERGRLAPLARTIYELVARLGGSASGEHGDGLLSTPFLHLTYGKKMLQLFTEVKGIFDPLNMFNPLKKVGASVEDFNRFLRKDFATYYKG